MTPPLQRDLDLETLRVAFGHHPSGLAALIAQVDGAPAVLVASSFTVGVSADPPLVSVAVQRSSTSWPLLRRARSIGVSGLAEDQAVLARRLAGPDRGSRLDGVDLAATGSDARFVDGASSWFEVVPFAEVDAGDHTLALLEVVAVRIRREQRPLVFHGSRFHAIQP